MVVSAIQFWQRIESSGLATVEAVRQMALSMADELPADQLNDTVVVAKWLIAKEYLTKYQARVLLDELTGPICCGDYTILSPLRERALPNWYISRAASNSQNFWLLAIPYKDLERPEFQANPPSVVLSRMHAKLQDASLCLTTAAQISDQNLCVASSIPVGQPLIATMAGAMLPIVTAKLIIVQLAMALDRLHEQNLVHGDITTHCVWWDGAQGVTLLRDPLFLPANPLLDPLRLGAISTDGLQRLRYAAPEFLAPGQQPSRQTDLYALGCLWYELLTGGTYVSTDQPAQISYEIQRARCKMLTVPGWSPRLQRVLHHLLAKNPASRFNSVRHFLEALQAAEPIISNPPPRLQTIAVDDKSFQEVPQVKPASATPIVKSQAVPPKSDSPEKLPPETAKVKPAQVAATREVKPQSVPEQIAGSLATPLTSPVPAKPQRSSAWKTREQVPVPQAPIPKVKPPSLETANKIQVAKQAEPIQKQVIEENKLQTTAPEALAPHEPSNPVAVKQNIDAATTSKASLDFGTARLRNNLANSTGRRKKKPVWVKPAMACVAICVLSVLAFVLMPHRPIKPSATSPLRNEAAVQAVAIQSKIVEPGKPDPIAEHFKVVADDGESLWAPPNVPDPISLQMLPPGLHGVLHFNVAQVLANGHFNELHHLLQPSYQSLINVIENQNPFTLDETKELTVAMYPNDASEWPDLVLRSISKQAKSIDEVLKKFKFDTPVQQFQFGSQKIIQNANSNIAILAVLDDSSEQMSKIVVAGSPKLLRQMIDVEGGVVPLPRQLEELRQQTSVQNDLTYLTTSSLLLSSGRGVVINSLPKLLPILKSKLREDVAALSLTTNISDAWYGELRLAGQDDQISPQIQNEMRTLLENLASETESMLIAQPASSYWAKLAIRLPQQIRCLKDSMRTAIEGGNNVANFYLPRSAASNLILAGWLSLREPSKLTTAVVVTPATNSMQPLTMDQILDLPINIAFDQESLEASAKAIIDEFNSSLSDPSSAVKIEINGAALEKDGITRNQQIRDFRHQQKPLREVLLSLVRKANPVTTVQSPTETDQKLVWVIRNASAHQIEITTRTAATNEKIELPKFFVAP